MVTATGHAPLFKNLKASAKGLINYFIYKLLKQHKAVNTDKQNLAVMKTYNYYEYRPIYKMKMDIKRMKKRLIREIMKKVKPCMWETGWVTNLPLKPEQIFPGHRNLWIVGFDSKEEGETFKYYKPSGLDAMYSFSGFTDTGCIITDDHMAIAVCDMREIPIEQLFIIHLWVMNDRYKKLNVNKTGKYKQAA